jgi:adenylate cyclase
VNEPADRFCGSCGRALGGAAEPAPAGPAPEPARDPRAYTPRHLVDKVLASRSALEGERKQVTVLFVDLKNSMELAESVDAEEWHRILDRFFQTLAEGVHRFEGTVNQYTGDGIMALFGAPIAHEDHAQRACSAALWLRDELTRLGSTRAGEPSLSFRMGLNSGEVVVGKIGADLRMDYTAQGHVVGLAQRMEALAPPAKVYLTEDTARLVEGWFKLRDLGAFELKGVTARIHVHELEGVGELRTRFEVSRARGLSRFVGRDKEMAALEDSLERAMHGRGQVIGVVAEAGTGKSRLLFEFSESCRARGLVVRQARGLAQGQGVPLLPVIEFFRAAFGVDAREEQSEARQKIARGAALADESLGEELSFLFELLGVPDAYHPAAVLDPEARERRLLELFRRVTAPRAGETAVFVFEDLQWIDPGTERFVAALAAATEGSRTLLLTAFRPEYAAAWMRRSHYEQIPLRPLDTEASRALVREWLGDDPSVAELGSRVVEKTAGNPFFLEEVVHSLAERGLLEGARGSHKLARAIDRLEIPATVQAVLAARIDRLPEREKRVLQAAAVIGTEFSESLVGTLAGLHGHELGDALQRLASAELIVERGLYPERQYSFKHPLIQDVAYVSQLRESRVRLHAAAARAIEASDSKRLGERAALIAYHWERAGDLGVAAAWEARAAYHAGSSAPSQAFRHWRRVRALLAGRPESAETSRLELTACVQMLNFGWREGLSRSESDSLYERALALVRRTGTPRLEAILEASYGRIQANTVDADAYLAHAERALSLAREAGDAQLETIEQAIVSQALRQAGRLAESVALCDSVLSRLAENPGERLRGLSLNPALWVRAMRGGTLVLMGRLDDAQRELETVIRTATERDEVDLLVAPRYIYTELCWARGDPGAALEPAREALEIAEKLGSAISLVYGLGALGFARLLNGSPGEGARLIEKALEVARERHAGAEMEARLLSDLAEAHLACGETLAARDSAERAVDVARRRRSRAFECQAELVRARTLRVSGSPEPDVLAALARVSALADETGAQLFVPFAHLERARLAEGRSDSLTRRAELAEAERLFARMGAERRAAAAREAAKSD